MLPTTRLIAERPTLLSAPISTARGRFEKDRPSVPAWMGVEGFVDIHCHVTPGLDDGPSSLEEAAALANAAYRCGTLAMIATPHHSLRYGWSGQAFAHCLNQLKARVPEGFALFAGCELELSDEAWRSFESNPRPYCLNSSRYVLVELPRTGSRRGFETVLRKLRIRGLAPIVAHAERCCVPSSKASQLIEWVQQGCLLQITADAICGRRGGTARAAAAELLQSRLAHFVASDAHDVNRRGPNLQPAYRVVSELVGVEQAARLFTHNPLRVLRNELIPT